MELDLGMLERIWKRFRREMWQTAPEDAVVESGVEIQSFGPVQATAFTELGEVPRLNVVQGAAEPEAIADGHLAQALEWMRAREVDYQVPVPWGLSDTEKAERWLAARGFEQRGDWETFIRDTAPPYPPVLADVKVLRLAPGEGEGMDLIAPEGLELPHLTGTLYYDLPGLADWRCYVALLDGEIVACGSMLMHEGIAELGIDSTLEPARGRGCNRALLARRLADAAEAGCHTAFASLSECPPDKSTAARHSLLQAAFEPAYVSCGWRRPGFSAI